MISTMSSGSTRSPGLRSRRAPSPPPTRTRPPMSRAWARERDSARPRSTRSWSSRIRAALAVGRAVTGRWWHRPIGAGSPARRWVSSVAATDSPAESGRRGLLLDCRGQVHRGRRLAHLADEALRVEADEPPQVVDGAVVHEPVGRDPDDADGHVAIGRIRQAGILEGLDHRAAEATGDNALLERHDQPLPARLVEDQLAVQWLREPGVDDPDRP